VKAELYEDLMWAAAVLSEFSPAAIKIVLREYNHEVHKHHDIGMEEYAEFMTLMTEVGNRKLRS